MIQLSKSNTTISEQGDTITQNEKEIKELKTDKATLETTQADLTKKLNTANSTVSETQDALSKLETNYGQKVAEYETFVTKAAQELAAKDEKISALNGELQTAQNKNRDYDSQIKTLNNQMADKNREIDDIGRRLKSTEEDRDHLLLEQKKLIAEKAELEKQFQDILVLRKKVQQLQVELMASKKLEWLRRGFYGGARKKGGSQLMSMSKKMTVKQSPPMPTSTSRCAGMGLSKSSRSRQTRPPTGPPHDPARGSSGHSQSHHSRSPD